MELVRARQLRHFFATVAVPCPYLVGQSEQKLVVELSGASAPAFYADLSRAGFRRSHGLAYRPACIGCRACVPVRIDVAGFEPTRSLRRVIRRNQDLGTLERPARATREQFRLFVQYQRARHGDSEMASMAYGDYRAMVEDTPVDTRLLEITGADGQLVGACLADRLADGYSAVYTFFDPDEGPRSLGTFAILHLVERARRAGLAYVYLGYWVGGSAKMAYKRRFPALQLFERSAWVPLPPAA